ncbi:hypothetical protein BESB_008950 [Besnoitia besnoiti]|uniref:Uncharacterized protein n=1 Tax=Besnoitia besnoiti TaxID=94643 RepID=A0A2A9MQJ8_BESBE|nr:hypothetical protein BESB_008950 [Besnoitia besnoiti]PFH38553.1 hypothetical protein BESB_008950 [Besnoitia besnoiti]
MSTLPHHGAAGSSTLPPLFYSDGQHTYVCVQGPNGPEYIQRREDPAAAMYTPTGFCGGHEMPPIHLEGAVGGLLSPQTTACSTSCGGDFAPASDSIEPSGNAVALSNPGKRRLEGGAGCNGSRPCHSEEHGTCERALKHSRSFGLTHVMSFSSVSLRCASAESVECCDNGGAALGTGPSCH